MFIKDLSKFDCSSSSEDLNIKDLCEILSDFGYEICKLRGIVLFLLFIVSIYLFVDIYMFYSFMSL